MSRRQPLKRKAKPPIERSARFRILPMTLSMLALLLVVKVSEIYFGFEAVRDAHAADAKKEDAKKDEAKKEESEPKEDAKKDDEHKDEAKKEEKDEAKHDEKEAKKEEAKKDDKEKDDAKKDDEHKEEAKEEGGHGESSKPVEEPKTAGAGKMTIKQVEEMQRAERKPAYTKEELDLLQNLTKRRQELEAREAELLLKSKVLEATEKRIGDKVSEMKTMEGSLSKVVTEYNSQRSSEIASLVKIYENMKPGDAAAIFNEMDMPILLEVIGKMSERKVAPVLAGMSPKKARDVTQELADMKRRDAAKSAAFAGAGVEKN